MAKPFVKWAGGKGKLLNQLEQHLPADFDNQPVTYIEPFVGGGAMLFHMLEAHPNINRVIINDINPELINCYLLIKLAPEQILNELHPMADEFNLLPSQETKRAYYYGIREEYNLARLEHAVEITAGRLAADFIFLNRTCFNGLYRENQAGGFNVPFGRYANPQICNENLITQVHNALANVEIYCGNYQQVMDHVNLAEYNFFYFDPPYRPLLNANNFKDYSHFDFGDAEQEALRDFCNFISGLGAKFMLSNSDSEIEPGVNYFEQIYAGHNFHHVMAPRVINAFAAQRVPQQEVLITNYEEQAEQ